MNIRYLERQLEHLDQSITRLKSEGPCLVADYWVDTYCHSQSGKRYYRRMWMVAGRRQQEPISQSDFEVLREQLNRGRKLARLQRKRDRIHAEIEKVKDFAERYGLSLPPSA